MENAPRPGCASVARARLATDTHRAAEHRPNQSGGQAAAAQAGRINRGRPDRDRPTTPVRGARFQAGGRRAEHRPQLGQRDLAGEVQNRSPRTRVNLQRNIARFKPPARHLTRSPPRRRARGRVDLGDVPRRAEHRPRLGQRDLAGEVRKRRLREPRHACPRRTRHRPYHSQGQASATGIPAQRNIAPFKLPARHLTRSRHVADRQAR